MFLSSCFNSTKITLIFMALLFSIFSAGCSVSDEENLGIDKQIPTDPPLPESVFNMQDISPGKFNERFYTPPNSDLHQAKLSALNVDFDETIPGCTSSRHPKYEDRRLTAKHCVESGAWPDKAVAVARDGNYILPQLTKLSRDKHHHLWVVTRNHLQPIFVHKQAIVRSKFSFGYISPDGVVYYPPAGCSFDDIYSCRDQCRNASRDAELCFDQCRLSICNEGYDKRLLGSEFYRAILYWRNQGYTFKDTIPGESGSPIINLATNEIYGVIEGPGLGVFGAID